MRFSGVDGFTGMLTRATAATPPNGNGGERPLLINAPEATHLLGITLEALKKRTQRYQMPAGSVVYTGRRVQYVRDRLVAPRKK
ncbi:MAG: hypothetical protein KF782_11855 [Labilithrix sp.]|nr:hypothetical protein [Labilithrix sp.]